MSLCIGDAKDEAGKTLQSRILKRQYVAQISSAEKSFDLKALAGRLEKVFPTLVDLNEQSGFIVVMRKVKLTEKGVVEGTGPAADRVQKVYEQFISEIAK